MNRITDWDWPDTIKKYTGRYDNPSITIIPVTEENLQFLTEKINEIIDVINELEVITGE